MSNVLTADFSRHLAQLHNRCSPVDKMELVAALNDIKGGTLDDPIHGVDDVRVTDKPRLSLNSLMQDYAA